MHPTRVSRSIAYGSLALIVLAICQGCAFAAEGEVPVRQAGLFGFLEELFTNLFNGQALMHVLAKPEYTVLAFVAMNVIVFVETGLLVGFFLPGDSLLVIAGLICANEECGWNLPLLLVTLSLSAIIGDSIGYSIGLKTGPKIFNREKSFFFKKDHLLAAQRFYETHGGKTIILARFIPILRTFAPVVAGVGRMAYRQFVFFNIIGGISWVFSMVLAGRFLPDLLNPVLRRMFDADVHVEHHVEKVVVIVVLLSVAPGLFAWLKSKLAGKTPMPSPETPALAK